MRVAAALLLACVVAGRADAQEKPPALTAPVNDFAGVIAADAEAALDSLIRRLFAASGDVLVVATVKTFQPAADIRLYANEMFDNHGKGIGSKERDNGMLIVLAVDDRQVWVEVGYDLEAIITDGFAGETSRQAMAPFFRQGDYGGGLLAGATRLAQRIAEARHVSIEGVPARQPVDEDGESDVPILLIVFVGFMVINAIRASLTGGRRRYRRGRRWTSSVGPFGAGYGGWSSGGRWSGGGGFGGGFGGFGGGSSGGGGGGASW